VLGIVTSFEYRLFAVGPEILGGAMAWRGEDARQVLEAYREFSAVAPRDLTSVAVLRTAPPAPWLPKEIHGQPIACGLLLPHGRRRGGRGPARTLAPPGETGG
jgi:hypothetical protein